MSMVISRPVPASIDFLVLVVMFEVSNSLARLHVNETSVLWYYEGRRGSYCYQLLPILVNAC